MYTNNTWYFIAKIGFLNPGSSLPAINFNNDDILKIIINKTHGHNNTSIRMIKICEKAIVKLLFIIYKNCIDNCIDPDLWKKFLGT